MAHTITNPAGLHDPTAVGYSHTAAVAGGSELVLVAGQYASAPDGSVVSSDFAEQVGQAFRNLAVAPSGWPPSPRRRCASRSRPSRCARDR